MKVEVKEKCFGELVDVLKINCGEKKLNELEKYEIAKDLVAVILNSKLSFAQGAEVLNIARESLMEVPLSNLLDNLIGLKDISDIGTKIKTLRVSKKLTQQELADKAGINRYTLILIENGKSHSSKTTMDKIMKILA